MAREIQTDELRSLLERGDAVLLLDLRESWEYDRGRLPGSKLLPLRELSRRWAEIPRCDSILVVLYCRDGSCSKNAASFLEHRGYGNVVSLAGGIKAWPLATSALPRY